MISLEEYIILSKKYNLKTLAEGFQSLPNGEQSVYFSYISNIKCLMSYTMSKGIYVFNNTINKTHFNIESAEKDLIEQIKKYKKQLIKEKISKMEKDFI